MIYKTWNTMLSLTFVLKLKDEWIDELKSEFKEVTYWDS